MPSVVKQNNFNFSTTYNNNTMLWILQQRKEKVVCLVFGFEMSCVAETL